MGNKTFDFSSKKKDFLPQNDQIWPKIGIFGQFWPGHAHSSMPCCGSVGCCGGRAVSRKTPIYFILLMSSFTHISSYPISYYEIQHVVYFSFLADDDCQANCDDDKWQCSCVQPVRVFPAGGSRAPQQRRAAAAAGLVGQQHQAAAPASPAPAALPAVHQQWWAPHPALLRPTILGEGSLVTSSSWSDNGW